MRVLELNVSPMFALMEHAVFNENRTQSTVPIFQQKQFKQELVNYKSLHMKRQSLTCTLYRSFLKNL